MSIRVSISTRFRKVSVLILLTGSMLSCNLLYDEGAWISDDRYPGDFQEVVVEGIANVYYHYSDTSMIKIYYYAKHLSDIKTHNDHGRVTIDNSFNGQKYTDLRLPEIHLYSPSIKYVDIKEAAGFFCSDTLSTDYFKFFMHGDVFEASFLLNVGTFKFDVYNSAGLMDASGFCEHLKVINKGETQIDAFHLQSVSAEITQQSVMDVSFTITDSLNYKIIRNGNILVRGTPAYEGESLGNGDLILIEHE